MVRTICGLVAVALFCSPALTAAKEMTKGTVELQSGGPLAFGPDGVLFVGDPEAAAVYAIATDDQSGSANAAVNVDKLDQKIAAALGTSARDILVNDVVVNPQSGNAYLSVSRGRGPDATTVLLRVNAAGEISEVSLKNVPHAKAELPNAPAPGGTGRSNQRSQAITDLEYHDGQLLVAGLSNEEFASTLRSIPYPFDEVNRGAGVEVFHGAHGKFETHSPVRTFTTYEINKEPHLLAAYTCTPLVRFPLSELQPGKKVRGTTIAELGNRNRPLDMIIYQQDGKDYILMANSNRGMMKIRTDGIDRQEGITQPVSGGGTAGQSYETIDQLQGVVQLDRLNDKQAVVLVQKDDGALSLRTIDLP